MIENIEYLFFILLCLSTVCVISKICVKMDDSSTANQIYLRMQIY